MSTLTPIRPLERDDSSRSDCESSGLSGLASINPLTIDTTEAHVRIAHENYSRTNPDLCGRLEESETSVSFLLFVPNLGQVLTYRAELSPDETPQGLRPSEKNAPRAELGGGAA